MQKSVLSKKRRSKTLSLTYETKRKEKQKRYGRSTTGSCGRDLRETWRKIAGKIYICFQAVELDDQIEILCIETSDQSAVTRSPYTRRGWSTSLWIKSLPLAKDFGITWSIYYGQLYPQTKSNKYSIHSKLWWSCLHLRFWTSGVCLQSSD